MILSRNNPSEIICSHCGQHKAEWVNPEEYYDYDGEPFWWSPRMEVGSYAGRNIRISSNWIKRCRFFYALFFDKAKHMSLEKVLKNCR